MLRRKHTRKGPPPPPRSALKWYHSPEVPAHRRLAHTGPPPSGVAAQPTLRTRCACPHLRRAPLVFDRRPLALLRHRQHDLEVGQVKEGQLPREQLQKEAVHRGGRDSWWEGGRLGETRQHRAAAMSAPAHDQEWRSRRTAGRRSQAGGRGTCCGARAGARPQPLPALRALQHAPVVGQLPKCRQMPGKCLPSAWQVPGKCLPRLTSHRMSPYAYTSLSLPYCWLRMTCRGEEAPAGRAWQHARKCRCGARRGRSCVLARAVHAKRPAGPAAGDQPRPPLVQCATRPTPCNDWRACLGRLPARVVGHHRLHRVGLPRRLGLPRQIEVGHLQGGPRNTIIII